LAVIWIQEEMRKPGQLTFCDFLPAIRIILKKYDNFKNGTASSVIIPKSPGFGV
jgi:hypothetical protein